MPNDRRRPRRNDNRESRGGGSYGGRSSGSSEGSGASRGGYNSRPSGGYGGGRSGGYGSSRSGGYGARSEGSDRPRGESGAGRGGFGGNRSERPSYSRSERSSYESPNRGEGRGGRGGGYGGNRSERPSYGRSERPSFESREGGRSRGGFGEGRGFQTSEGRGEEFTDKRDKFMKRSRQTVMEALKSRDMLLSSVTRSMEDMDQAINQLGERLEDWYGIYFPELRTEDKIQFCNAVLVIDRDNMDETSLSTVLGPKRASELIITSTQSLGVKLSQKDLSECLSLARAILAMDKLRKEFEAYQKSLAEELCPNMTAVGGADIAARLVSHVGSLARLAILPASAIQVLGAEKALFKHLKNRRIPPPKHGIIFQHVRISASPKMVRGKIARALANKLCLAAKADAFSKRDISAELKQGFDTRYSQIMKEYEQRKKPKANESPSESPSQGSE